MPSVYPMSVLSCIWCRLNRPSAVFMKEEKLRNLHYLHLFRIRVSLHFIGSSCRTYSICSDLTYKKHDSRSSDLRYNSPVISFENATLPFHFLHFLLIAIRVKKKNKTARAPSYTCILHLLSLRGSLIILFITLAYF